MQRQYYINSYVGNNLDNISVASCKYMVGFHYRISSYISIIILEMIYLKSIQLIYNVHVVKTYRRFGSTVCYKYIIPCFALWRYNQLYLFSKWRHTWNGLLALIGSYVVNTFRLFGSTVYYKYVFPCFNTLVL